MGLEMDASRGVDVEARHHLADSFQEFGPFTDLQPAVISMPMWRAALRRKSPRSAPGADGLSRRDLLAMPQALTEEILSLLRESEAQGVWPQQPVTGLISSLAKVAHYRPICIPLLCYRTWSSLHCKEALRHVAQFAPPGLLGNLPAAGAMVCHPASNRRRLPQWR